MSEPEGKPDPLFALPSTVNWMRALALLTTPSVTFASASTFYGTIGRRSTLTPVVENTVMEQLLLGLHHLAALERMKSLRPTADVGRIGVLAWYYGITNAASAMIAAQNGSFQEDHAGTAAMWDTTIASPGLAMDVFGWRVTNLMESTFAAEVSSYRGGSSGDLQTRPSSVTSARGVAAGYLSGSAKWYAWRNTEDVRTTKAFRDLGVTNFRTKKAQAIRDARLSSRSMGFLHQASRYRGKANYREALFLAYGRNTEASLVDFVCDQAAVLKSFVAMAGAFSARRLGKVLWEEFVADVEANRAFSIGPSHVWS